MNLEMKLQDVRDEAVKQEQLNGLKKSQLSLKDLNIPKDAIFKQ